MQTIKRESKSALSDALAAAGVSIAAKLVRLPLSKPGKDIDWEDSAFHWECVLKYQGREMKQSYKMGCGNVKTRPGKSWEDHTVTVGAYEPSAADVVSSLVLDGSACDETFEDWCSNFGSDTDSRKALETYLACQEGGKKIRRLLGADFDKFAQLEH